MALDGFSVTNVGLGQDKTSAQMALNTERAVLHSQTPKGVETIANAGTNKAVTLDGRNEKEKNKKRNKKKKSDSQSDGTEDAYKLDEEFQTSKGLDFYTKFADKLAIRLNRRTEAVELYDKETKKTIESITALDLMKLVEKLNISSGVLINRKI